MVIDHKSYNYNFHKHKGLTSVVKKKWKGLYRKIKLPGRRGLNEKKVENRIGLYLQYQGNSMN